MRVPFPPPFEIGPFFQDFGIGLNFQFNLNISEGEENAGAIQSVPADRGIIISKNIHRTYKNIFSTELSIGNHGTILFPDKNIPGG